MSADFQLDPAVLREQILIAEDAEGYAVCRGALLLDAEAVAKEGPVLTQERAFAEGFKAALAWERSRKGTVSEVEKLSRELAQVKLEQKAWLAVVRAAMGFVEAIAHAAPELAREGRVSV